MNILKRILLVVIVCLAGIIGVVESGIFNVAAINRDNQVMAWLLHTTMERSVERRAQNVAIPEINNHEMRLAGLSDYVEMCAQCHGEPGEPPGILAQGLNPAPPDFEHLTEDATAAEMFWIISNGIRMTGMPAFGKTHQADEIWPVVAFLQSAKEMTATDYTRMKKEAEGYGHHHEEAQHHQHDHDDDHLTH